MLCTRQYPVERAARVAVSTVRVALEAHALDKVVFCCFSAGHLAIYQGILGDAVAVQA